MSFYPTELGKEVRLNLQLTDGEENLPKVVKAVLKDHLGNTLPNMPLILTHVGGGLFKNFSELMPNVPEMTAQYFVYEDDGVTLSDEYDIPIDVFYLSSGGSSGGGGSVICEEFILYIDDSDL